MGIKLDDIDNELKQRGVDPISGRQLPVNIPTKSSLLDNLANNPVTNFALGAGDAVRNAVGSTASLLPGINIAPVQSSSGASYGLGKLAGNVGTFAGGGELLDMGRAASEGLPYLGKIAQSLGGNVAGRAVGTGLGGMATDPNNRLAGFGEGLGMSLGLDTLGALAKPLVKGAGYYLGKVLSAMNPEKHTASTISDLANEAGLTPEQHSSGQALENNGKLLAQNVKNSYENNLNEVQNDYSTIFSHPLLDNTKTVYKVGHPIEGTSDLSEYEQAVSGKNPYSSDSLNKLHSNYVDDPTLPNAQRLQSELGKEGAYLSRKQYLGTATSDEVNQLALMNKGRDAAKNDIRNTIHLNAPQLTGAYDAASDKFLNTVVPYYGMGGSKVAGDSFLKEMATGKLTNPSNSQINSTFSNPEPGLNQVISDIGEKGKNQILYNTIGKLNKSNLSPEKLISADDNLDQQGLGSYRTDNYRDNINALPAKIKKLELAERVGGAVGGGALGALIPIPGLREAFAGIGAYAAPNLVKQIPNFSGPNSSALKAMFEDYLKKSYQPVGRALIANRLQGSNQYGTGQ